MRLTHWLIYWFVRVVYIIAIIAAICVLLIPSIPNWSWALSTKQWVSENGKTLGLVLVPVVGVCSVINKYIGAPWLWTCVKGILSGFQRDAFSNVPDVADHHRVTLYRYHRICLYPGWRGSWKCPTPWGYGNWPWSGWLIPTVRAGPDSAPSTIFLAKDAINFEGVCGAAYFQQQPVVEKKIVELPNITQQSTEDDIIEYARQTWVSPKMIRKRIKERRPCARWFLALRVEVQYKKWGVLMIDSRADAMPQTQYKAMSERLNQIKDVLSHLLKVR